MDDAKEIWEAIRTRFGGNANSKKCQKAVFKQQFEAFKISNSEGLEKGNGHQLANTMIAIRMKKFYKKTGRRVRVDGKTPVGFDKKKLECFNCHNTGHFARECTAKGTHDGKKKRDSLYQQQETGKQEKNQMGLLTMDDGIVNWGEHTEAEETNHALMAISSSNEVTLCSKTCIDSYNTLKTLCDEQMNQLAILSKRKSLHSWRNEIYEKDEKLKRYRRIGMKAVKEKEQLQKTVDSWKDSSKNLWKLIDSGMSSNSKPLYSRFTKTNDVKGVPPPLSGDYTPIPQEELDDSLFVYGKKGPQKPEIHVSDNNASKHSSCQSNDSEGSCEDTSKHSFKTGSESLSDSNEMFKSRLEVTKEKDVSSSKSKEVEPSCVSHIKTPRQPLKDKETHQVDRKNWNDMMKRELGEGYSFTKKKCFVCGSLNHLIKDCDYYEKKKEREAEVKRVVNTGNGMAKPVRKNANRINHANKFVPRPVQLNAGRPKFNSVGPIINFFRLIINSGRTNVNPVRSKVNAVSFNINTVGSRQPVPNSLSPKRPQMNQFNQRRDFSKPHSSERRPLATTTAQMPHFNAVVGNWGSAVKTSASYNWRNTRPNFNYNSGPTFIRTEHPLKNMVNRGIFDSGCSGHMTDNKDQLEDFEEFNGVFVTFRGSKGYISGKGRIRHKVLFTETECLVVSSDFKMPDENQILLKVPRHHNMYSFDMKTPSPAKGFACLIAKATSDESKLWHRRLGHINFKNLNKLVKGNLVRGLPSKVFKYDHTCVACQKGKQHRASCKAKLERLITKPLHTLHMDLFGPTSVKSINHASYCLVITDDCTRFCWVFFLASKDETSGILQTFIRQIENQLSHRVKIIRSDNGTEFKNRDMLEFCGNKGIKQEYSNARTPQQNGVAERMNRTLIEAARTMLADSLLPTTFWAEAVSTACYIFNRVRVTKPQHKTPYELLFGHKPIISYIRPFGCHVTILDTLSVLGKFDRKSDEGFLVGYSLNSKAYRVYNLVTKRVEVNLHVNFLEEKPNVKGVGYRWMFDIDYLTDSMNYIPVSLENQANNAGILEETNSAGTSQTPESIASEEKDKEVELIVVPSAVKIPEEKDESRTTSKNSKTEETLTEPQKEMKDFSIDSLEDNPKIQAFRRDGPVNTQHADQDDSDMPELTIFNKPQKGIFDEASYDDEGMVHDFNNLPIEVAVSPILTLRIHNIHPQSQILDESWVEAIKRSCYSFRQQNVMNPLSRLPYGAKVEGIDYDVVFAPVARIEGYHVILLAFASFYEVHTPRAWYATLSTFLETHGYRRGTINKTLFIKKDKKDIMMVQVFQMSSMGELIFFLGLQVKQKTDGLFISQDKYVADLLKKFDLASLKTAITPMETKMALTKDEEADDVDVHLYRSMIGSLMYLTVSRPDIMFAVCACSRFLVTPKTSHLNAVKRIFKYLKGKPNLGLWYP
ncbi:putative ribonuclease H-like domain-containing protein [Tanacetum coccineum]